MRILDVTIGLLRRIRSRWSARKRIRKYLVRREPWSIGYDDYKWDRISEVLNDPNELTLFSAGKPLTKHFGQGIDERIVEYPFVFSNLTASKSKLLDAGSTFNFSILAYHPMLQQKEITIFTAFPEGQNISRKGVAYQYGDLRKLPFPDRWFDEVACISTLEHIGMDNSIYGEVQQEPVVPPSGNESYLEAVDELMRVLKPEGQLFITVPFGKKINYGYFQQFDSGMAKGLVQRLEHQGRASVIYYAYDREGWQISDEESCKNAEAHNPHTGRGKGDDGAAHSRALLGIHFRKSK